MFRRKLYLLIAVCALVISSFTGSGRAVAGPAPNDPVQPPSNHAQETQISTGLTTANANTGILSRQLLAKAQPDECFYEIGSPYPPGPPCEYGIPKVNQAYVWGLTKTGTQLWFGTAPNVHCLVISGYLGITTPHETDSWVCEYGSSQFSPPLPDILGDWRAPQIFKYDTLSSQLTEMTPAEPLLNSTLGIRSAGTNGQVVMLAGPGLPSGLNLFAFNKDTGEYLGATNLPDYTNIRKWVNVEGVLYTGVRNLLGSGNVLRWTGDLDDPFQFEVVGNLDSEGAELAFHEGRLFVSTWPNLQSNPPSLAGLFMSPVVPNGGLTNAQADEWQKVWQASDYEPDPVTAATYGGGALASFDGYLYWGTMHVPFMSGLAHINVYGTPDTQLQLLETLLRSHRAISIFRGRNIGTEDAQVDLLYGEEMLPVYSVDPISGEGVWQRLPNNMGQAPLWGSSGFGNFYNNYTWTMAVYKGQLYVGTMDWSYLFMDGLQILVETILGNSYQPTQAIDFPEILDYGADLFRFSSANAPAVAESQDGLGNYSNYGIRTMLADDGLYLGTANPMNLMTDLSDDKPEGGWELIRMAVGNGNIFLPFVSH